MTETLSPEERAELLAEMRSGVDRGMKSAVLPIDTVIGLLTSIEEAEGHIQQIADEVGESDDPGAAWEAVHAIVQQNKALTARAEKAEQAIREAIDLLLERIHHNPARSAAHNARLTLQAALFPSKSEADNA